MAGINDKIQINHEVKRILCDALSKAANEGLPIEARVNLVGDILQAETGNPGTTYEQLHVVSNISGLSLIPEDPIMAAFEKAVAEKAGEKGISYNKAVGLVFDEMTM